MDTPRADKRSVRKKVFEGSGVKVLQVGPMKRDASVDMKLSPCSLVPTNKNKVHGAGLRNVV